ncbi:MAG: peptidoglycan DD-metalloendopeptidase family protein [Propionibacteriaceae bacterium]|nr:peptidoglycan DD-metalloendopeptidase family protein [Propionibacteriaceae bacterium]
MRRFAAGVAALAIGMSFAVPASADDLDDQRDRVAQGLTAAQQKLDADTKSLANASAALKSSQTELATARTQLADTQRQLAQAEADDKTAARRLAQAQNDLEAAKAAVAEGERQVAAQRLEVGNVVRTQYQQRSNMVGIGMVVTGTDTGDISNRVQWSQMMMAVTQTELEKLEETQAKLVAAQQRQAKIEEQMAAERTAAAANLTNRQKLAAQAVQQEQTVALLVQQNSSAELTASQQLEASQNHAKALTAEQQDVEARILDRMRRQQEEDARRAETERLNREAREKTDAAQERANQAQSQRGGTDVPAAAPQGSGGSAQGTSASSGSPFIKPVAGPVTSRYGMRLHPVLKVWKLHDGTDYGAACNTPLRAAADGVVTERYYNAGYGNRLMIDHGRLDGRYLTTGYNHATHYTVRVGERVKQGDVVGYVGTTGYSTGCHLHLMVWSNGKVTNPQTVGF